MNNVSKHTASGFLRKQPVQRDWSRKDFLTWGLILVTALTALVVLWAPLMMAPLSEITGAFMRLHHSQ